MIEGLRTHLCPVAVELVGKAKLVHLKQYPMTTEANNEITPYVHRVLEVRMLSDPHGILIFIY